jgi:ABC-2 type transport system permease protein
MTSVGKVRLVATREWNQRVRTVAFRTSTILAAALAVAIIVLPQVLGDSGSTQTVGLVGAAPTAALFATAGDGAGVTVRTRTLPSEAAGEEALRSGDVDVLLVEGRTLVWEAEPDERLVAIVTSVIRAAALERAIEDAHLTPAQLRLLEPPALGSRSLEPTDEERSANVGLAFASLLFLFAAISFYGGFLLVGVLEEKSSRVIEVLLSRLTPTELLWGKTIGIGLVGLAQLAVVAIAGLVAFELTGDADAPASTPETIAWTVFWFVLGFGFYAVLYAAAGSLVSRQEEAQSMTLPVAGILVVGYLFATATVESPDGVMAIVGSLLPPSAPMVMIVRIAFGTAPLWQIVLSALLTVGATVGLAAVAGRIYAGAVLRLGRRVKVAEAWHAAEF